MMAFNFQELNTIKDNISSDSEELTNVLSELNNLITSNIGNVDTWDSKKATEFLGKWNDFSTERFPSFENSFKSQIKVLDTAIRSYQEAENSNGISHKNTSSEVTSKSPYEEKIEKLSENNEKPSIINQENTQQAINENIKDTKELSSMFNEELYNGFKAALVGGGLVVGATKVSDKDESTKSK